MDESTNENELPEVRGFGRDIGSVFRTLYVAVGTIFILFLSLTLAFLRAGWAVLHVLVL